MRLEPLAVAKDAAGEKFHFGRWLKERIAQTGTPVNAFAAKIGVDKSTLHGWSRLQAPNIRRYVLPRIARELRIDLASVEFHLDAAKRGDHVDTMQRAFEHGMRERPKLDEAMRRDRERFVPNVDPYSEEHVPHEIPLFDLSVAAGSWTDVSDVAEVRQPGQIDHGRFRIRIRGDSMTATYKNGDVVEFRCLRDGRDSLEVGRDYYVQRADGTATFKRLEKFDDESITLRALNRRKYRQSMVVERREIVRMALAEWIMKRAGD